MMAMKLIYLLSLGMLLSLMGPAQAQNATWIAPEFSDYLWNEPINWSEFPTPAH